MTVTDFQAGHSACDAQRRPAGLDRSSDQDSTAAIAKVMPMGASLLSDEEGRPAMYASMSKRTTLADPTLALAADVLDDLERTRIANENRLRQLTRSEEDGFGLTEDHPDVARLVRIVDGLSGLEHEATLNLQRAMRKHPLGPWVKAQKGVGEKQAARLLAAIGDPYWNYLHDRPRTVSELWAYCGLRPGQRRKRGERSNWSANAKMRAYLIADKVWQNCTRDGKPTTELAGVGHARKAATEGRLHAVECVRCGPSGKPAQPGTPWSDAHRHADALRIVSKRLLRELWRAARDIHLGHIWRDAHPLQAEVDLR